MRECIVIGQTNVGKTTFALSFAEYLGMEKVHVTFTYADGFSVTQAYALSIARQELVGTAPNKTRCLQSLSLSIPQAKGFKAVEFVDSTGLTTGIHADAEVRRATTQTLRKLREAHLILHIVDVALLGRREGEVIFPDVDQQIAVYAGTRSPYALIANKMDLPTSLIGLSRLKVFCPGQVILPVSALTKQGFREVKAFVGRQL